MSVIDRPQLVVPSFTAASPADLERVAEQTAIERVWYEDHPVYETVDDLEAARDALVLVTVEETEQYRPIDRFFIDPENHKPYLTPAAFSALEQWAGETFEWLRAEAVDTEGVQFAVTSMARSVEQNQRIVSEGKLAVPDSSHTRCGAWDIDMSGYYRQTDDGLVRVSVEGRREGHQQLLERLRLNGVDEGNLPVFEYESYDPEIPRAGMAMARQMQDAGIINAVLEFSDTPSACFHMAANPDY